MYFGHIIILLFFMGISWLIGNRLKSKFKEYGKVPLDNGMSGKDIAEKMLYDNDIHDVKVQSVPGQLTDHYNPASKTINLSPDVYSGNSVAAAAVAAHETGHAVQHATAYSFLQLRTAMVPVVNIGSKLMNVIFLLGIFGMGALHLFNFDTVLILLIASQGAITLFSVVTLPVEIDASRRALAWLGNSGITYGQTQEKAQDALKWAAYTYVVSALAAISTLLYYIMLFMGRRD